MSSDQPRDAWTITDGAPDGEIHDWFGLTYANYLVLPRSALQSMPAGWQERFVACLREMRDHFDGFDLDPPGGYRVQPLDERKRFSRDRKAPHYNRGRTFITRSATQKCQPPSVTT